MRSPPSSSWNSEIRAKFSSSFSISQYYQQHTLKPLSEYQHQVRVQIRQTNMCFIRVFSTISEQQGNFIENSPTFMQINQTYPSGVSSSTADWHRQHQIDADHRRMINSPVDFYRSVGRSVGRRRQCLCWALFTTNNHSLFSFNLLLSKTTSHLGRPKFALPKLSGKIGTVD